MNEAAFSFNSRQNSTKNQITEPGSLADLLPALMDMQVRVQSAVQMARSQMRMENLKPMHIKRFVAICLHFDTQFTIEYGSSAALFGGQGGNITRQATSLLLRASEVVTDFFMCITQPIAHLCGAWPAVLFYIEHKDAH